MPLSVAVMKTATPQSGSNKYGLGIFYVDRLGYGHNGAVSGYLSQMLFYLLLLCHDHCLLQCVGCASPQPDQFALKC